MLSTHSGRCVHCSSHRRRLHSWLPLLKLPMVELWWLCSPRRSDFDGPISMVVHPSLRRRCVVQVDELTVPRWPPCNPPRRCRPRAPITHRPPPLSVSFGGVREPCPVCAHLPSQSPHGSTSLSFPSAPASRCVCSPPPASSRLLLPAVASLPSPRGS